MNFGRPAAGVGVVIAPLGPRMRSSFAKSWRMRHNSTTNLTSAELVKIFQRGTLATGPDGKPITIVLRDPAAADHALIFKESLPI